LSVAKSVAEVFIRVDEKNLNGLDVPEGAKNLDI